MAITVTLHDSEAVFTCGALEESIKRYRDFCRETDHKYGDLNDLHRQAIGVMLEAHKTLLVALRASGYPMTGRDIPEVAETV